MQKDVNSAHRKENMESTNKSGVQFVQRPVLNQVLQAITLYAVSGSKKGAGHNSELTNEALLVPFSYVYSFASVGGLQAYRRQPIRVQRTELARL